METRDQIRYWGGAIGAVALVGAIVVAVVVVQTPAPKAKTAPQTQMAARTPAASVSQCRRVNPSTQKV